MPCALTPVGREDEASGRSGAEHGAGEEGENENDAEKNGVRGVGKRRAGLGPALRTELKLTEDGAQRAPLQRGGGQAFLTLTHLPDFADLRTASVT